LKPTENKQQKGYKLRNLCDDYVNHLLKFMHRNSKIEGGGDRDGM